MQPNKKYIYLGVYSIDSHCRSRMNNLDGVHGPHLDGDYSESRVDKHILGAVLNKPYRCWVRKWEVSKICRFII